MSYFRVAILECSKWLSSTDKCGAYIGDDLESWFFVVAELRRRAKSDGWFYSHATGDLCPTCYQNWLAEVAEAAWPEGADDGPAE